MVCQRGFHYCRLLCDVFDTYDAAYYTKVFEIEATGRRTTLGCKSCTNKMRLVRELSPAYIMERLLFEHYKFSLHKKYAVKRYLTRIMQSVVGFNPSGYWIKCELLVTDAEETLAQRRQRRLEWARLIAEQKNEGVWADIFSYRPRYRQCVCWN